MAKKPKVIENIESTIDYKVVLSSNPNRDSLFVCKDTGNWYWLEESAKNNCKNGYDSYTKSD